MTSTIIRRPEHPLALGALRSFEATARLGSLTAAAAELHVTKSAISHQLRGLEENLGVALLVRGGKLRQVEVTLQGQKLLQSVRDALLLLDSTCREIRNSSAVGTEKTLNISSSQSIAELWLTQSMHRFVNSNPDITLEFHQHTNQNPAWKTQHVDLAIMHVRDAGPHLPQEGDVRLMDEYIVPFCSAEMVPPERTNDPTFIGECRWIQERHVDSPETSWDLWQRRLGLPERRKTATTALSSLSTVVSAVQAGAGIGLGRLPLISEQIARGSLVALMPATCLRGSWRYVARVRPGRIQDDSLSRLLQFLVDDADRLQRVLGFHPKTRGVARK